MEKRKRNILFIALAAVVVVVVVVVSSVVLYRMMVCNAVSQDSESHGYYVYPNTPLDSVLSQMAADYQFASLKNVHLYARHAKMQTVKSGHYRFSARVSSRTIVNFLMRGYQTPVQVRFNNQIRNREQLAGRLGQVLLIDSVDIMQRLDSLEYLQQFGLNRETAVCLFIPDTYEMFWTISVDDLFARMNKEYQNYWNAERRAKAKQIGLTPTEVATLASIVASETYKAEEHPTIASVYLNRLRKGMHLQACPTVIFAKGDFSMHRVLNRDLQMDSPYNTYKYAGLPPGPIRLTSAANMDAVLNAPKTDYLYMCANPDWTFTHVFSSTYAQHSRVAVQYRRELNKRKIKK